MPKKKRATRSRAKVSGRTSLRAFAKVAGISQPALTKAVRTGRLSKSIGRDAKGKPFIADPAAALAELREQATRPRPVTGPVNGSGGSLAEAQRRLYEQREIGLALTNQQRQGQLLDGVVARREFFEAAREFREAMLAIPDRNASQLAAETDRSKIHAMLEEAIRSALETVAEAMVDGE